MPKKSRKLLPIYYPIETMARELDARILFSLISSNRGRSVFIGHKADITRYLIKGSAPSGFYIHKSIAEKQKNRFQKIKSSGHRVLVNDEEGLIYPSANYYNQSRVSKESMKNVEIFFCWGKKHASDVLPIFEGYEKKIVIAGNPRFDLLRSPYIGLIGGGKSRNKFKILVNTNFGLYNPDKGRAVKILGREMQEGYNYKKMMARLFKEMIHKISDEFPLCDLVVRPHPSEDIGYWVREVGNLENLSVRREGSAIYELSSTDILIHNGCTTGIEARFMGVEVLSYEPLQPNKWNSGLPHLVSRSVETLDQVIESIRLKKEAELESCQEINEVIKFYIENASGDLSIHRMLQAIEGLENSREKVIAVPWFNKILRLAKKKVSLIRNPGVIPRSEYSLKKCPHLKLEQIEEKLYQYCSRDKDLKMPDVSEPWPGCFRINSIRENV